MLNSKYFIFLLILYLWKIFVPHYSHIILHELEIIYSVRVCVSRYILVPLGFIYIEYKLHGYNVFREFMLEL